MKLPQRPAAACALVAALLASVISPTAGCSRKDSPPKPIREGLDGPPRAALLLTQAWFWTGADGKQRPGWARLDIWREGADGWKRTRLEDPESNVFHKALPWRDGILTIGAERALLKLWHYRDGSWTSKLLWEGNWDGKFDRLRDLEIGDVDHDGKDELVLATHDSGVVAVVDPGEEDRPAVVTEMDRQADTFVHEIEIGDIDGDGELEFFATPSGRNQAGYSQSGGVVMYRWNGERYDKTWVEHQEGTHAKEILAYDVTGDGTSELFSVLEAEVGTDGGMRKPVEIRLYRYRDDGSFEYRTIGTVPDRQTRFLVPGDLDRDGRVDLIAPALQAGVFLFRAPAGSTIDSAEWTRTKIGDETSGFEHAAYTADLDGDGAIELYVAGDEQGKLIRYDPDGHGGFRATVLGALDPGVFTFNITSGTF